MTGRPGRRFAPRALLYRVLAPIRPGRLLPEPLAYRLRRRLVGMPVEDVLAALEVLEAEDVDAVVAGGWGIDALAGRQTRRHGDLDLLVHPGADGVRAAVAALAPLGYRVVDEAAVGAAWAPVFTMVRNPAGRTIELLPATAPPTAVAGRLDGRPVRCVSAQQQLDQHRGYRHRAVDRADLALLAERPTARDPADPARLALRLAARLRRRRSSALVVLAPEAEPVVDRWRLLANDAAATGVPAHVTVLYPFLSPLRLTARVERRLARALVSVPAFTCRLDRVARFPGVVYLAPDVTEPFLRLLAAVQGQWPRLEPYGGRFDDVVPHLTVADDGTEPEGMVAALEAALPICLRVEEVALLVEGRDHRWRTRARFPLGPG